MGGSDPLATRGRLVRKAFPKASVAVLSHRLTISLLHGDRQCRFYGLAGNNILKDKCLFPHQALYKGLRLNGTPSMTHLEDINIMIFQRDHVNHED